MISLTHKSPTSHHFSLPNPTRLSDRSRPCMIITRFTWLSLSLSFLSTDDKGNFLIQWLSRADPEFPAPKISSSKRPLSSGQAAVCTAPAPACHLAFSLALWLCYTLPWMFLLLLSGACAYLSLSSCSSLRSVGGCFSLALLHLQPTLGSESIRSLRVRGVTVSRAVRKVAVKWWTPFWWKVSSTGVIRDNSLVFRRLWSLRGGLYYIISI